MRLFLETLNCRGIDNGISGKALLNIVKRFVVPVKVLAKAILQVGGLCHGFLQRFILPWFLQQLQPDARSSVSSGVKFGAIGKEQKWIWGDVSMRVSPYFSSMTIGMPWDSLRGNGSREKISVLSSRAFIPFMCFLLLTKRQLLNPMYGIWQRLSARLNIAGFWQSAIQQMRIVSSPKIQKSCP